MCFLSKKHFEIEKIFDFISKSDFRNERVFENFVSKTSISKQNFEKAFRKKISKKWFRNGWFSKLNFENFFRKKFRKNRSSPYSFDHILFEMYLFETKIFFSNMIIQVDYFLEFFEIYKKLRKRTFDFENSDFISLTTLNKSQHPNFFLYIVELTFLYKTVEADFQYNFNFYVFYFKYKLYFLAYYFCFNC